MKLPSNPTTSKKKRVYSSPGDAGVMHREPDMGVIQDGLCSISDALWGGELGWARDWDAFVKETCRRIRVYSAISTIMKEINTLDWDVAAVKAVAVLRQQEATMGGGAHDGTDPDAGKEDTTVTHGHRGHRWKSRQSRR
jgi:hypothetical protein